MLKSTESTKSPQEYVSKLREALLQSIRVSNVVLTFDLGLKNIVLDKLATRLPTMEYNPKKFAAGIVRLQTPRCTILMFASGNMVCTGASCADEAHEAIRDFACMLRRHGIPAMPRHFCESNAVASAYAGYPLQLNQLHEAFTAATQYEPDNFPGCTFRRYFDDNSISFVLFRSGKIVITGATRATDIAPALEVFFDDVLWHYLDHTNAVTNSAEYRLQTMTHASIDEELWMAGHRVDLADAVPSGPSGSLLTEWV